MTKTFKIVGEQGLHARLATLLVNKAVKYKSNLFLECNGVKVDMKSIMGVMSLGVYCGEVVTIYAEGEDELLALEGITELLILNKLGREL